jgi:hypothetical protein
VWKSTSWQNRVFKLELHTTEPSVLSRAATHIHSQNAIRFGQAWRSLEYFLPSSPSKPLTTRHITHTASSTSRMDRRFVTVNANEDQVNTPRSNAAAEIPQPEPPRKDIHKNIVARNYALNDATADFAVICEDQRFMAHKAVLVAASPYFARMLRFQGKVNHSKTLSENQC